MDLTPKSGNSGNGTENLPGEHDLPRLGEWFWCKSTYTNTRDGHQVGEEFEWLGCVMSIGSNYILLEAPHGKNGYRSHRIHVDALDRLRPEPEYESVIARQIELHQGNVNALIREVNEITQSLGLRDTLSIAGGDAARPESRAIATLSGQQDVKTYEIALLRAKEETLPELFKKIERENSELASWMQARTMPLQAQISPLKQSIDHINDRIFSISLYAGLTEEAVLCSDGAPCSLTVPASELLNVSAYRPGDYKKFFRDPRTRADYLQWAPLLLAAENFHAGKLSARDHMIIEGSSGGA